MKKELKQYTEALVNDLSDLIKIPTVFDEKTVSDKMPYGEKVYQGYLWMKKKALQDGFEVLEFNGHALAIRIPGNISEKRVDVVSHIDVVEPGNGWVYDPFSGLIQNNRVYGRGTQDMKGMLLTTFYALKYIKDNAIPCKNELRVVIGCDEEHTMGDMKYYIKESGEPAFAFTPDGKFPYSLGEKGALMWIVKGGMETCIEELEGGVQFNVISPCATALVNDVESFEEYRSLLKTLGYEGEVLKEDDKLRINITGKAAHASRPEDGINATVRLLELIGSVSHDPLAKLLHGCFCNSYGEGGNINYDIEPMGKLTINLGILRIKEKTVYAEVDCRYPYGITSDILTEKLSEKLSPLKVVPEYDDKPTLADKESPYLKVLLDTYRHVSKDPYAEPVISSGVTYSKAIANCVAFGPSAEGDEVLAHQANENIEIGKLEYLLEMYSQAMIKLANLD